MRPDNGFVSVSSGFLSPATTSNFCEGVGDVVGVVTPLGGVAQVVLHGVQVVKVRCAAQGASGQRSGRRRGRDRSK